MNDKTVRLAAPLQADSIVDGEGIRTVVWFQGCSHNCEGCHNPESHDFNGGYEVSLESVANEIKGLELQDGVTFSGGDPIFQPEALLYLLRVVHELGMTNWVYTGFTFEQLLEMSKEKSIYRDILEEMDVLVDGKFELTKRSFEVMFRGSSNQRVLDVKNSLKCNKVIIVDKYK